MKLKDVMQELRKYNFESETNITTIEKSGTSIVICTEKVKPAEKKERVSDFKM